MTPKLIHFSFGTAWWVSRPSLVWPSTCLKMLSAKSQLPTSGMGPSVLPCCRLGPISIYETFLNHTSVNEWKCSRSGTYQSSQTKALRRITSQVHSRVHSFQVPGTGFQISWLQNFLSLFFAACLMIAACIYWKIMSRKWLENKPKSSTG